MRKISLWASRHRIEAIACIAAMKLTLAVMAFYLGSALSDSGIFIPFGVLVITMITFLIAALLYPSRRRRARLTRTQSYLWQKSCDFTIAACSFMMITTLVNSDVSMTTASSTFATTVSTDKPPTAEEILASLKYRDKSTLTRQEKRILKEEFKKQLKVYVVEKVKGNSDGASNALLITLTIIAALGLLYLVAILACNLSCNGSDAAAVIVAILGAGLVIFGAIVLIRRIVRGPKNKDKPASEQ